MNETVFGERKWFDGCHPREWGERRYERGYERERKREKPINQGFRGLGVCAECGQRVKKGTSKITFVSRSNSLFVVCQHLSGPSNK